LHTNNNLKKCVKNKETITIQLNAYHNCDDGAIEAVIICMVKTTINIQLT